MIVWLSVIALAVCVAPVVRIKLQRRRLMALRWPRQQGFFQMRGRLQRYFAARGWEVRTGGLAGIDRLIMRRAGSGDCVIKPCLADPDTRARTIRDFAELNTFAPGKKHTRIMVMADEVSWQLSDEAYSRGVFVLYYKQLGKLAALQPASPADVEACLKNIVEQGRPCIPPHARPREAVAEVAPLDEAPLPILPEPPVGESAQDQAATIRNLLEAGRAALHARKPPAAVEAFCAVLAHSPSHVGALSGLAAAHHQSGAIGEAVEAARKAVATAPRNAGFRVQLAQLLHKAGRADEAALAFDVAVSIDPAVASAHAAMSDALGQQRGENDPIAALQAEIEAAPSAQRHVDLGHMLTHRGDCREAAEAQFRSALVLDPAHPGALMALAALMAQKGDFYGAIALVRTGTEHAPRHAGFHVRLGQLLEETHDLAAAEAAFAQAAALDPRNAAARAGVLRARDPGVLFALFDKLLGPGGLDADSEQLSSALDISQDSLRALLDFARDPQAAGVAGIATSPLDQALLHAVILATQRQGFAGVQAPMPRLQVAGPELDGLAEIGSHDIWTAARWLNAFIMRRARPRRRAAVIATMRDEGLYLLEWVAHYRVIGFDTIFIYANDNLDGSDALLRALAEHGIITFIENRMDARLSANPQQKAYAHAQHMLPELWEHEWALVVDGDELLVPSEKYDFRIGALIEDALSRYPDRAPSALCFNWFWYFSGYAYAYAPGPLLRRFAHGEGRRGIKSLVRLRDITSLHRIHYPEIARDGFLVRADFSRLDWCLRQKRLDPVFTSAWLAHYWNKSFEEFSVKKARGDAACDRDPLWKRDFETFFTTNGEETAENHHPAPEALIAKVEAEIAFLHGLPGIAEIVTRIEATRLELLQRFDHDGGLASIYESAKAATTPRP